MGETIALVDGVDVTVYAGPAGAGHMVQITTPESYVSMSAPTLVGLVSVLAAAGWAGIRFGDAEPTGAALEATWQQGPTHIGRSRCPACTKWLGTLGLRKLVYSFERCACGQPADEHLVQQLWHRECFAVSAIPAGPPS